MQTKDTMTEETTGWEIWHAASQRDSFLASCGATGMLPGEDAASLELAWHDLSFYQHYGLVRVRNLAMPGSMPRFYLHRPANEVYLEDTHLLDSTNDAIYAVNSLAPIVLTLENVADYVRFFFQYVKGRHGQFVILEYPGDIQWATSGATAADPALVSLHYRVDSALLPLDPVYDVAIPGTQQRDFATPATILFHDAIYYARILIAQNGRISLTDERVIVEGLAIALQNRV